MVAAGDFFANRRFSDTPTTNGPASAAFDEALRQIFTESDLAVVNFEGSIVGRMSSAIPKTGPHLRMDPRAPAALKDLGVDVVSMANNHIMDHGPDALRHTLEVCSSAGLACFGAGENRTEALRPLTVTVAGGTSVAMIGLCESEFGIAGSETPGAAPISDPSVEHLIAETAKCHDVVVVSAHGGVEYAPFSPVQRQAQLRRLAEAGATIVIGHHPHVPQGWETFGDSVIFHSLGNFYFNMSDGRLKPRSAWGLVVRLRLKGAKVIDVEPIPVVADSSQWLRLAEDRQYSAAFNYLDRLNEIRTDPDLTAACWQETAVTMWRTKYRRRVQAATFRSYLGVLAEVAMRKLFRRKLVRGWAINLSRPGALYWLNVIRTESHRWTQDTALSVLLGDQPDLRTPDIRATVAELFRLLNEGLHE